MKVCSIASMITLALVAGGTARADINGFDNFSQFRINQGDSAASPSLGIGWIRLTSHSDGQRRSVFSLARQDATQFVASFTYKALGSPNATTFGACFVIENSPAGASALGSGSWAYGEISRSVAISMEMGQGSCFSGVYRNGVGGGGSLNVTPIDFLSGHEIDVSIAYANSLLTTSFVDRATHQSFTNTSFVDIQAALGGSMGHVGFTAGTGTWTHAEQYISNFRFSVPTPGAAMTAMLAGVGCLARRRR